jgi:exodeoxyribonuclease V alpha subunit
MSISKERLQQIIAEAKAKNAMKEAEAKKSVTAVPTTIISSSLAERIKAMKAKRSGIEETPTVYATPDTSLEEVIADIADVSFTVPEEPSSSVSGEYNGTETEVLEIHQNADGHFTSTDRKGNVIELNEKQSEAVSLGVKNESFVLIGAAGTGKTTSTKEIIHGIIQSGSAGLLDSNHKVLAENTAGIVCAAYTRRAVSNIRRNMSHEMQNNCITIHKLLQYEPVYDTVYDSESGDEVTKMRFVATRNAHNPLSATIKVIILDEASMISVELYREILDACPHNPQFIFLGDIQQLPPVFGSAILGFKMLELPTIELTEVYRQALESPIIRLAHRILSGVPIAENEFAEWKTPNQLTLHPWKKKLSADVAVIVAAKFFTAAYDAKQYDPMEDMILLPFNKGCGTIELNQRIATHLAHQNHRAVYEVIAGFNKLYFSVGDKVLVEKEDAEILSIKPNPTYLGQSYLEPSLTMDYFGYDPEGHKSSDGADIDIDKILDLASTSDEDRVRKCSHIIRVRLLDTEREVDISSASEVNAMLLAYALTVHKSQGSEWRKVFIVLHQSHATMLQRELLYTGTTRAREELYVICEPDSFVKGIESQRIKGNTLAEKAIFFQGKVDNGYLMEK